MSITTLSFAPPRGRQVSWIERVLDRLRVRRARQRLNDELQPLSEDRLRDIGFDKADLPTRFATEMRKVDALGLTPRRRY